MPFKYHGLWEWVSVTIYRGSRQDDSLARRSDTEPGLVALLQLIRCQRTLRGSRTDVMFKGL